MHITPPCLAEIIVATHFFAIIPNHIKARDTIYSFAGPLLEHKWGYDHKLRRNVRLAGKVWGGTTEDFTSFRYPISLLPKMLKMLEANGIEKGRLGVRFLERYEPAKANIEIQDHLQLRDYQEEALEFTFSNKEKGAMSVLLNMPTGTGKAQPLDSFIRTPDGWARMGEMYVGRDIIAADGSVTKVTGVYPQGIKPRYRITFSDFRTADCCEEHLWKVYVEHRRDLKWRIVTTKELIRLKDLNTTRCFVPLYEPKEGTQRDLPIDPYVLGLLLGNGGMSQKTIKYSTMDLCRVEAINEYFNKLGIELIKKSEWDYSFRKIKDYAGDNFVGIANRLRSLGLQGKLSYQKEIPAVYMEGSMSQRLALVQGMMDSDGTAEKHGSISYSTSSLSLALSFQHLIHSLGGIAKVVKKNPTYTYKGEKLSGRANYVVHIRYKNPRELFQLPRKRDRLPEENQYSKGLKLRIDKIELIGTAEMQCISVEHPEHLYLTDGFVVTHNTITLLKFASLLCLRTAIVASATYSEKWKQDILSNTKTPEERIFLVSGRNGIKKIFSESERGIYNYDFTIFSIETLQRYFKEYEANPELCAEIYGGTPVDLWEVMKCGFLGGDEMHENLFSVYWLNTFLHGPFHLGLSATMVHRDPFIETRQKEVYPVEKRFDKIKMKKYINFVYFGYRFKDFDKSRIKTSFPGKSTYAQDAYEQSLISSKESRDNFVDMVVSVTREYYVNRRKPGDKLRIYFSRIKMINLITDVLKNEFPDLDVQRYAEDDEYSIIINSDIGVTNRGKAGTGVDIPGLTTVINFTNVESSQAVLQLLGRLRDIKDTDVIFVQAYCKNIKKHLQYKDNCHGLIHERVKGYIHHDYGIAL